MESEL